MAVFHNLLLRSLNTIYLQAPYVKDADKKAFVGYSYCWYDAIDAHHTGEEKEFFPWIEEAAGEKGIMDANVEQHSQYQISFVPLVVPVDIEGVHCEAKSRAGPP